MAASSSSSSFDEAAFALVQALSPTKRVSRDQIPYSQLRHLINDFFGGNKPARRGTAEDRRSSLSTVAVDSDDNNSRMSFEDHFSLRTQSLVRVASNKTITATNNVFNKNGGGSSSNRLRREVRKMHELRTRRRNARRCQDRVDFDCDETLLPDAVANLYSSLLHDHSKSASACFDTIVNSVINFYSQLTWTDNVQKLTATFLRKFLLKSSDRLCEEYDDQMANVEQERRVRDYETQILIELYTLRFDAVDAFETSTVVNKMRFIYFVADAGRMKTFLEETIADEFSAVIPQLVVKIYEELCISIPCDLKDFAAEPEEFPESLFVEKQRKMMASRHMLAIDRLLAEDGDDGLTRRSDRAATAVLGKKNRKSLKPAVKGARRSLAFDSNSSIRSVPDTPDEKLTRKRKTEAPSEQRNSDDQVVLQTPVAKMKRSTKLGGQKSRRDVLSGKELKRRKVSILLHKEEERQSRAHSAVVPKSLAESIPKHPTKTMNKEQFLQHLFNSRSTDKKTKAPSPVKTPCKIADSKQNGRETAVKRNLLERHFSERGRSDTQLKNVSRTSLSPDAVGLSAIPTLKILRDARGACSAVQMKSPNAHDDEYCIAPAAIERYRKRIEKIRTAKYRGTQLENEVFYGRGSSRTNLFEEALAAASSRPPCTSMVTRSNGGTNGREATTARKATAKNRQGRVVAEQTNCCHMAHALLNVHNLRPLSPVLPKTLALKLNSPFKLQRMLRRPSRARRRLLDKRKQRSLDANSEGGSVKSDSSRSASVRLSVSVDCLSAEVNSADRCRLEKTLLLSPRANGRLKSAENMATAKGGRPRSLSISDFPSCPSPSTARRSARLLSSALAAADDSCQTAVSFESESSSSSAHFADTENTLSADDVYQIMQEKMQALQEDAAGSDGSGLPSLFDDPPFRARPIPS